MLSKRTPLVQWLLRLSELQRLLYLPVNDHYTYVVALIFATPFNQDHGVIKGQTEAELLLVSFLCTYIAANVRYYFYYVSLHQLRVRALPVALL